MKSVLILIFTFVATLFIPYTEYEKTNSDIYLMKRSSNVCPSDNDLTRGNVERFISHPDWSDNRTATGTSGLSLSQLKVLTDSQNSSTCQYFNSEFADTINESWADNSPAYHIVYYKAGGFYFVSIVVAQCSDPEYVSVGLSYLIVFDTSLNEIKGYSF